MVLACTVLIGLSAVDIWDRMYNVGVGGKVEGWVVYFQVESKK